MALESNPFSAQLPIEYYGVKPPRNQGSLWLALPCYAFKVFGPKPQERKINTFEKVVLQILLAGKYTAKEIGEKMKVEEELANVILDQLEMRGFLDRDKKVTESGAQVVRDADWAEGGEFTEYVTGFVYQSACDLSYHPRFVHEKKYAKLIEEEGKPFPKVDLSRKDRDWKEVPWFVTDRLRSPEGFPEVNDIVEVVRKHGLALRFPDSELEKLPEKLPPVLQKVSVLDEEPQKVWVLTVMYLPEGATELSSWEVMDPFGPGRSAVVKRLLGEELKADDRLWDRWDKSARESRSWLNHKVREAEGRAGELANKYLQDRFGAFALPESWRRPLRDFEVQYHWQQSSMEINGDLFVKAQILLETVFKTMKDDYPVGYHQIWEELPWRVSEFPTPPNPHPLEFFVHHLGGDVNLPLRISNVTAPRVRSWVIYGGGSLRPMVVGSVLATYRDHRHPLHQLMPEFPDLLHFVEEISILRDKFGHAEENRPQQLPDPNQVRETLYQFLTRYLQLA